MNKPAHSFFGHSPHWSPGSLDSILHTLSFEILLPHTVVIPLECDIKISAIDVKSGMSPKTCHTHIISILL